ncbi:MAG: NAD(P)H-dependent oxidoreductase [Chloroflexi bacterium]|nr:NAD(P)H-dependent oxidoreductase [Chloroflexota bacterium]
MNIVGINGSLRSGSWNRMLLRHALKTLEGKGVEAQEFDLNPLPLYNADIRAKGMPVSAVALRSAVEAADGVILTTPEYNGTFSAAIKNAVEWFTQPSNFIEGKAFAIMASSPGRLGAAKTHMPLSYAIESEGGLVLHRPKILLPLVNEVFSEDGQLLDESTGQLIEQTMDALVALASR